MHSLEATDDFFRGKLAATFPLVLVGAEQGFVHGENSLRCAVAIDNGQPTHLAVGRGAERPVDVVIGLAGEDGSGGDFSDGQTPRQPVSCS